MFFKYQIIVHIGDNRLITVKIKFEWRQKRKRLCLRLRVTIFQNLTENSINSSALVPTFAGRIAMQSHRAPKTASVSDKRHLLNTVGFFFGNRENLIL